MLTFNNDLPGSEPSKKRKKEPTGILKDLMEFKRFFVHHDASKGYEFRTASDKGKYVLWSDVEAIINKYMNP